MAGTNNLFEYESFGGSDQFHEIVEFYGCRLLTNIGLLKKGDRISSITLDLKEMTISFRESIGSVVGVYEGRFKLQLVK